MDSTMRPLPQSIARLPHSVRKEIAEFVVSADCQDGADETLQNIYQELTADRWNPTSVSSPEAEFWVMLRDRHNQELIGYLDSCGLYATSVPAARCGRWLPAVSWRQLTHEEMLNLP